MALSLSQSYHLEKSLSFSDSLLRNKGSTNILGAYFFFLTEPGAQHISKTRYQIPFLGPGEAHEAVVQAAACITQTAWLGGKHHRSTCPASHPKPRAELAPAIRHWGATSQCLEASHRRMAVQGLLLTRSLFIHREISNGGACDNLWLVGLRMMSIK